MSGLKSTGNTKPLPIAGSGCGIKPSKEALDSGYGVDFSKAKELLENKPETEAVTKIDK